MRDESVISLQRETEEDRICGYNPFLISSDTAWVDSLYDSLYPIPGSLRHKSTFVSILVNLSREKLRMKIALHKKGYTNSFLPSMFLPSGVSDICDRLSKRGYITINRGFRFGNQSGTASTIEPTGKLLSLIPPSMSYEISEEGLVIPKGFTPTVFPPQVLETRLLLAEYNKTVEPENMLYATHKDSFDLNGRFTGSAVIRMPKVDRAHLFIDGEPTVELDISNCIPFILYATELGDYPPKDCYSFSGLPRPLAKKSFLIAINSSERYKVQSAIHYNVILPNALPMKATDILEGIEDLHCDVTDYLYCSLGTRLMYIEAQCMARFMRSMLDKGIKFYPIYDSVRVPVSKKEIALVEFRKAFTISGVEPIVHED